MELDQPIIKAIRETKPIDYEDKIDKFNNTIDNVQSYINALSFNQLPAIQSKKCHIGIKRAISDTAITSLVHDIIQKDLLSSPTISPQSQTRMYYNFNSNLETYDDLLTEYQYIKLSILFNYYVRKIKNNDLTTDT